MTKTLSRAFLCVMFVLPAAVPIAMADEFAATDHQRRTIYHSPQTPGYTCWVGAWIMPDDSLMVSFTQATGPATGRARAPKDVQEKLGWPPPEMPGYDMTGLDLCNVHLRSTDSGKSWQQVSADPFKSCMNGTTCEPEAALPDGSIMRAVWGHYLPYNPELPKTGYLQRSTDGSKTWSEPQVPLDPGQYTAWPKRIRVLRDGRVIVIGGIAHVPADSRNREAYCSILEPLLIVSKDNGKTWSKPIAMVPEKYRANWGGEECDAAEQPNGDLLCMFRRRVPELKAEARWQGVLTKCGDSWTAGETAPAPFPHSGHPELLATHEGPTLHVAPSGIHYTNDAGKTWQPLDVPGTAYYPHAVQTREGRIFVFGHIGSDDAYGATDQSIVMDSFRLTKR